MSSWTSTPAVMRPSPLSQLLLQAPVDPAASRLRKTQAPPPITTTTPMGAAHRRHSLTHSHLLARRLRLLTRFPVLTPLSTCQMQGAASPRLSPRQYLRLDRIRWHERDPLHRETMRIRGRTRTCSLDPSSRERGTGFSQWYSTHQIRAQTNADRNLNILLLVNTSRLKSGLRIQLGSLLRSPSCPHASTPRRTLYLTRLT